MTSLGNGLYEADHYEDALSVREADLSTERRVGAPEENILIVQSNIANTYHVLGRHEEALNLRRDVYSGQLELSGEEHDETIRGAVCYAMGLISSRHFKDAKALALKTLPVARRVLGNAHEYTLRMRALYAEALHHDPAATFDDLREAVMTLEDAERILRRVFGGAHPLTVDIENELQDARAALSARDAADMYRIFGTDSSGDSS